MAVNLWFWQGFCVAKELYDSNQILPIVNHLLSIKMFKTKIWYTDIAINNAVKNAIYKS